MNPTNAGHIEVTVVEHDPGWTEAFEKEAAMVRGILGDDLINLFHIGSTSVAGLAAKPVIDILAVVADISRLDGREKAFAGAGYEAMGEFGLPGRRYFRKGGARRTHQIHAYQYDSVHEITRHLAFRDYLRENAGVRVAYEELKLALAKKFPHDIGAYCDGKDDFIKRAEAEALRWYWRRYA